MLDKINRNDLIKVMDKNKKKIKRNIKIRMKVG